MRFIIPILSVASLLSFLGCAHHSTEPMSLREKTMLPTGTSITALNALANGTSKSQADRARAVFTLFGRHIRPESSAPELRQVFKATAWLQETRLIGVRALAGWVPVKLISGDTVFCLHLFPADADKGWSPWVIYFRLSGELRDEDALAFLQGESVAGNPKILEFALCYPERRDATEGFFRAGESRRRIEHFSGEGLEAYDL